MIVDLKERQPVTMMPGGVISSISFRRLIEELRKTGEISKDEIVTHVSTDLNGLTFRIETPAVT